MVDDCSVALGLVEGESGCVPTRVHVPKSGGTVGGGRDDASTVTQVVEAPHTISVALEGIEAAVGVGVPKLDRMVMRATHVYGAVNWVGCKGIDRVGVVAVNADGVDLKYGLVIGSFKELLAARSEVYHFYFVNLLLFGAQNSFSNLLPPEL